MYNVWWLAPQPLNKLNHFMHPNQEYCRYLRGKNAFGTLEGGEHPFRFYETNTTTYWCIRSMAAYGPDGGVAHITTCGNAERSCFAEVKQEKEKD